MIIEREICTIVFGRNNNKVGGFTTHTWKKSAKYTELKQQLRKFLVYRFLAFVKP